jgi:16S rRNA (uracil1498-N3)-methyltransferase
MKIHRFYIPNFEFKKKFILDNTEKINQIKNVFRAQEGDTFAFFFDNREAVYEIVYIDKKEIEFNFVNFVGATKEKTTNQKVLCMSLIKSGFEDIVRSATEIGIEKILPIIAERSEKKDLNIERMNKIAIEASEQCGRMDILTIENPIKLKEFLASTTGDANIIFDTVIGDGNSKINKNSNINLYIGPEGGWTEEEKELFRQNKFEFVKLDTNILKAETAGVVGAYWLKTH